MKKNLLLSVLLIITLTACGKTAVIEPVKEAADDVITDGFVEGLGI